MGGGGGLNSFSCQTQFLSSAVVELGLSLGCENKSKLVEIGPKKSKLVQIGTNGSKWVKIGQSWSKKGPYESKLVLISPIGPNLAELVQIGQNLSK